MILESMVSWGHIRSTWDMDLGNQVKPESQFVTTVVIFESRLETNVHVDLRIQVKWIPEKGTEPNFLSWAPASHVPVAGREFVGIRVSGIDKKKTHKILPWRLNLSFDFPKILVNSISSYKSEVSVCLSWKRFISLGAKDRNV